MNDKIKAAQFDELRERRLKKHGIVEVNSPHDCDDPTSPPPFRNQRCRCNTPTSGVTNE